MLRPLALLIMAASIVIASFATAETSSGESTAVNKVPTYVKMRASKHVKVGRQIRIRGRVRPGGYRKVILKVGRHRIKVRRTGRYGYYRLGWRKRKPGRYKLHVKAVGNGRAYSGRSRARRVNVYRPAAASYYGPGLYGNPTACGGTLTPYTIGVANKTLPCGKKLKLRYRGRSLTVRVIDRGPYAGGREYDLTERTKNKLGFPSTGTVLATE